MNVDGLYKRDTHVFMFEVDSHTLFSMKDLMNELLSSSFDDALMVPIVSHKVLFFLLRRAIHLIP
jgi:hypothetical protein